MRTWFSAKAATNESADIAIYDEIGAWGIKSADFRDALSALGPVKTIDLRLNSPGGDVFDGLAIYNMLARHPAKINVTVDGIAASIASIIAMAGDTRDMPENAFMMIHNPSGIVMGEASDMDEVSATLRKIGDAMVATYARRTGQEPEAIAKMMNERTWFTAHEAVALGFADTVLPAVKLAARYDAKALGDVPPAVKAQFDAAYDPDGDGDDDILECLGYIGAAFDALADAVGCLTGIDPENPDAAQAATVAKVREVITAKITALQKALKHPAAVAEPGNAAVVGAPGKDADPPKAQAEDKPAPTANRQDEMLQICATCELAGFAEMSSQFMRSGKSLSQVQAELRALRADRGRGVSYGGDDVSARHAVEDIDAAVARRGWDKAVNRLNARLAE